MGYRRPNKKPNATGRSDTSRFVRLDHRIWSSSAYRALSPNARSLLIELAALYNGTNNGSLYLSVRDAAACMGVVDLTAANRAFDELVSVRLIELTGEGYFRVKASETSRARCWRLTWLYGPGRKAASWDFGEPAPQTRERKRMERGHKALKARRRANAAGKMPVLDSDTLAGFEPESPAEPVLDSNTPNQRNGSFPPKLIVPESNTHIATTMGSAKRAAQS